MNTKIELPAKDIITALALNGWSGRYKRNEWRAVGLWWAKVISLVGHPDSRLENARLQKLAKLSFDGPPPDLAWLTDGSGPPIDASVFVHRSDLSAGESEFDLVVPAQVNFVDGSTQNCHVLSLSTPGLCVTFVSHPGIRIEHPKVEKGEAWELLHSPPRRGDLANLTSRGRHHVKYLRGGGVPSGHVVDQSEFSFLTGVFDYESDQVPHVGLWTRVKARARRAVRNNTD